MADASQPHTHRADPAPLGPDRSSLTPALATPWSDEAQTVAAALAVDPAVGLDPGDAAARLEEHGPNELSVTPPRSLLAIVVKQFTNVLVALLAGAALLSIAFGQWAEAAAVLTVLVLNAGIGAVTELRAVRSVESLRSLGTSTATVSPTPNICTRLTREVAMARKTTATSSAAAVTMRPVRSRPTATDSMPSPVRSCSSLIRDRRNTS